jgi:DNA-binding MarR family transcriptional regulator
MPKKTTVRRGAKLAEGRPALPWNDLELGLQLILNADFLAKEYRRNARQELVEQEVNDRRAAVIVYLDEIGPQSVNDLARRLEQHKAAISALLIRMEADGYIEFTPSLIDRRSKSAGLTAKGMELAAPIQAALNKVRRKAIVGLSDAEIERTNVVLQHVIANLGQEPVSPEDDA